MPAHSPSRRTAACRVAALSRSRTPDDPAMVDARRDLRAEALAEHIERVVDDAPPLTAEQRDRLASLLRPTGRLR